MAGSRATIEANLDRPVLHFAYPYGDRSAAGARDFAIAQKLGFRTAVTTRSGMLFAEHAERLTEMPRLLLNGNYQDERLLKVLTSGTATGIRNAIGI
jgi:peptidoglycan/xylan/chitin deacetylase (PgdA/CDA1 family)